MNVFFAVMLIVVSEAHEGLVINKVVDGNNIVEYLKYNYKKCYNEQNGEYKSVIYSKESAFSYKRVLYKEEDCDGDDFEEIFKVHGKTYRIDVPYFDDPSHIAFVNHCTDEKCEDHDSVVRTYYTDACFEAEINGTLGYYQYFAKNKKDELFLKSFEEDNCTTEESSKSIGKSNKCVDDENGNKLYVVCGASSMFVIFSLLTLLLL